MNNPTDDKSPSGPAPWGSDPIKGLEYDYLDIEKPPAVEPTPVMPERVPFNALQAQDFYTRIRSKIVRWAEGRGADQTTTSYILILPDLVALFVRLMADPSVSAALKMEIAAASAYVISPIDLLPEAFMGPAGLIDDVIVAAIAVNRVVKAMGQAGEAVLLKHWDGDADLLRVIRELLTNADSYVSGPVWSGIKKFMGGTGDDEDEGPIVQGRARPASRPKE